MSRRCLYVPTESGHCTNCAGLPEGGECPMTGEPLNPGNMAAAIANLREAGRAFVAAAAAALGIAALLKTLGELIERTADDDRS